MEVDLFDFVEQYRHLVRQALGKHAGEPASGGFARWKHVVLHCFRLEEDHSYRETPNRLEYMAEIRDVLKYELYALSFEPLILQRGSRPLTLGHNALIRAKGYSQRWIAKNRVRQRSAHSAMPGERSAGFDSAVKSF
jgi:hypothetical protein